MRTINQWICPRKVFHATMVLEDSELKEPNQEGESSKRCVIFTYYSQLFLISVFCILINKSVEVGSDRPEFLLYYKVDYYNKIVRYIYKS